MSSSRSASTCARSEGDSVLEIAATEKSWGPWFYRLGASAMANLDGKGEFTGNVLVRRPNLNRLGGEWKAFVLGRLDRHGRYGFLPAAGVHRIVLRFAAFVLGVGLRRVVLRPISGAAGRCDDGRPASTSGPSLFSRRRASRRSAHRKRRIDPRSPTSKEIDDDTGGWRLLFKFDGLDNANFPRSGTTSRSSSCMSSRDSLGADREYERLFAQIGHAWTIGKWAQIASAFGTDLGSESSGLRLVPARRLSST